MSSNFDFLSEKFPVLADYGKKAENYLYSDSNSCLMKLGMIGETVVNLMFRFDRIPFPYDNTAAARIDTLYREGMVDSGIRDILHALRKTRNKAVHENYSSVDDGKALLQMAYSLCVWFYQIYGDYEYQPSGFVMPPEEAETAPAGAEKEAEEQKEQKLAALAEEAAAAAPAVPKAERKKKAAFAANQRPRTEAETRFLIDEQLRKVGWEADTNTLRYSKGARPKKGHNMAIALGRRSVLIAMATGTGKTRTVLGMIYRFLKSGRFHRILFLVDGDARAADDTDFRGAGFQVHIPGGRDRRVSGRP